MSTSTRQWEVVLWLDNDRCETSDHQTQAEAYKYAHDNMGRCSAAEIYGPDYYDSCYC